MPVQIWHKAVVWTPLAKKKKTQTNKEKQPKTVYESVYQC